jgi:hypothetical protein
LEEVTVKKILHLGIALAFLLALVPVGAMAHTEGDPYVTDLLAGQDMDVGDVLVWNDGVNLYVKYAVDDPWCLTETHLHVSDSPDGIPHTNKGNPIPGKFNYGDDNLDCVDFWGPIEIPLNGWEIGTELYIAAHAVVLSSIEGCYETVWQIGEVEADPYNSNSLSDEFLGRSLGPEVDYYIPPNDYTDSFPVSFTPLNYVPLIL